MNAPKQLLVFVVALSCVFSSTSVFSQQKDNAGKEFYLAFGTNQGGGKDDNSFQLYITGKSATKGIVTAVATPISLGKTVCCYEVVITNDEGERTCTARITCLILAPR